MTSAPATHLLGTSSHVSESSSPWPLSGLRDTRVALCLSGTHTWHAAGSQWWRHCHLFNMFIKHPERE